MRKALLNREADILVNYLVQILMLVSVYKENHSDLLRQEIKRLEAEAEEFDVAMDKPELHEEPLALIHQVIAREVI